MIGMVVNLGASYYTSIFTEVLIPVITGKHNRSLIVSHTNKQLEKVLFIPLIIMQLDNNTRSECRNTVKIGAIVVSCPL
jgi:hypothetical protein